VNVYLVCDNCGYIHGPDDRPCLNCGCGRYWTYLSGELDRALKRSRVIQERVAKPENALDITPHRDPHG
jgi:hypothetical protein